MATNAPGKRVPSRAQVASWGALTVAVIGAVLFGSILTGVGDWVEGRQLQTVAPWAIPGLVLTTLACLTAVRALLANKGHWIAVLFGLTATLSILLLFLINPSIAPPVP